MSPPLPQHLDHVIGDGDEAVFVAFGFAQVEASGLGVDVANLEIGGLAEAQAAGVDEGEGGVETWLGKRGEELRDFPGRDDDRKGRAVFDLEIAKDLPGGIELEVFVIEGAQGDPGLVHGAGGILLLNTKEEEVLPDLFL